MAPTSSIAAAARGPPPPQQTCALSSSSHVTTNTHRRFTFCVKTCTHTHLSPRFYLETHKYRTPSPDTRVSRFSVARARARAYSRTLLKSVYLCMRKDDLHVHRAQAPARSSVRPAARSLAHSKTRTDACYLAADIACEHAHTQPPTSFTPPQSGLTFPECTTQLARNDASRTHAHARTHTSSTHCSCHVRAVSVCVCSICAHL